MTYNDVKSFSLVLYDDLHEKFFGEPPKRLIQRSTVDDEDMANIIQRSLINIQNAHKKATTNIKSPLPHRIIVLDEVDTFQSNEKAFNILVTSILNKDKKDKTNTSIVGIANSVDLPFRKKYSAIAMRDS